MNKALSDAQYSSVVGVIARVPVVQARRQVLEKLQAALRSTGKITEDVLAEAINNALASIPPASYHLDPFDGVWRAKGEFAKPATLLEASQRYMVALDISHGRRQQEYWPPHRPLTDEEMKAKAAEEAERVAKLEALGITEPGDRYLFESLCNGDVEMFQRRKAEDAASAGAVEIAFDPTQPPPAKVLEPMPLDRIDAIPLDASEYSVVTDENLKQKAVAADDEDEPRGSEMAKAARLARKRAGSGRLKNSVKVFFR